MRQRIIKFSLLLTVLYLNPFGVSQVLAQEESEYQLHPVAWENKVNLSLSGTTLTKTTSNGWNAGMFSINRLSVSETGIIEHRVAELTNYYMFGFSKQDGSVHYNDIEYAWYVHPNGFYIYKSGRYVGFFGGRAGDVLQMEKTEDLILLKKNGVIIREYPIEEPSDYYIDVSVYKQGSFEFDMKASFEPHYAVSKWRTLTNMTVNGTTMTKTSGGTGWNAGFFSEGKIPSGQDGFIEHKVMNQSKYYMVGLSSDDPNADYRTLEYTWYVRPSRAYIYKSGSYQTYFSSSVGDVLRIEKVGNYLYFKKNNITMRTYTINPNVDYHIDGSFYHLGTYDVPIEASFSNPAASYAILKKKLDGSCQVIDGDIKFKFIQEYAITTGLVLECKIYDWQRNIVAEEDLNPNYGINWFTIPSNGFNNNEIYTLEFEGNKGQKYFLKFKYKTESSSWDSLEENASSEQ